MIVKVKVTSPFRYEYQGKRSWVASGENLTLDTSNKNQREELKYIMSSNFPYKEFIYIDVASLPEAIKCEVREEAGFYKLPPTPIDGPDQPGASDFFRPLGEAEDNKFIHPVINSYKEEEELALDKDEPLIETKLEEECIKEEIKEEQEQVKEEKQEDLIKSRKAELSQTPWSKVKDIVESYGEEYTNKSEAIELILMIEFD